MAKSILVARFNDLEDEKKFNWCLFPILIFHSAKPDASHIVEYVVMYNMKHYTFDVIDSNRIKNFYKLDWKFFTDEFAACVMRDDLIVDRLKKDARKVAIDFMKTRMEDIEIYIKTHQREFSDKHVRIRYLLKKLEIASSNIEDRIIDLIDENYGL